jgi:hypothetical protein
MQRDRQIGHGNIVEVAPAQVVDVRAHRRRLEAEEALTGTEVAQMQQEVELGAGSSGTARAPRAPAPSV